MTQSGSHSLDSVRRVSPRLLILEDDLTLAHSLAEDLFDAGYEVELARTTSEADLALNREPFAAVFVDLGLPQEDGLSFLRRMRDQGISTPMLVITARDTLEDCVASLDAGADDFLAKPFRLPELLARLRAAIRRQRAHVAPVLRVGRLEVNLDTHDLRLDDAPFDLTPRERVLLENLMAAVPNLVRKDRLIRSLSGMQSDITANAVEVYISRLRPKLERVGLSIRTVHGIGYRLEEERRVVAHNTPQTAQG